MAHGIRNAAIELASEKEDEVCRESEHWFRVSLANHLGDWSESRRLGKNSVNL